MSSDLRSSGIMESDAETSWWSRRCGGRDVLNQAIPIIISTGSLSLMNFTDRMFLMNYQSESASAANVVSAAMTGGMLFWATVAIPSGTAMLVTTFVAQYCGSGHRERIGPIVWQGIWIGLLVMPLLLLLSPNLSLIFSHFEHSAELLELEQCYYLWLLWGSGAVVSCEAAASFFRGLGRMKVEMMVNLFCITLNILLDYFWIFGTCGFPRLGLAGAAIATVVAQWVRLTIYLMLIFYADHQEHQYRIISGMKPDFNLFRRLLYYGVPSSLYLFFDTISFTVFVLVIGGLGEVASGASTIAFTLNAFTFLPLVGIGIVVSSMVGNQLGENRPDLARRATYTALLLSLGYTAFFGALFIFLPEPFLVGFAYFQPTEHFEPLKTQTIILLRFVAFYLVFDSCAILCSSALRGAGDTLYVMYATFALSPLFPTFCYVGIRFFGLGLYWCWTILSLWVVSFCVVFALRFLSDKWETCRVIEPSLLKHE